MWRRRGKWNWVDRAEDRPNTSRSSSNYAPYHSDEDTLWPTNSRQTSHLVIDSPFRSHEFHSRRSSSRFLLLKRVCLFFVGFIICWWVLLRIHPDSSLWLHSHDSNPQRSRTFLERLFATEVDLTHQSNGFTADILYQKTSYELPPDPMQVYYENDPSGVITEKLHIRIQPSLGKHRYAQDAIFILAQSLHYESFVLFLDTLTESGYRGDIVMSVPQLNLLPPKLLHFLTWFSEHGGLVVYDDVVRTEYNDEPVILSPLPHSNITTQVKKHVIHPMVYLKGLYTSAGIATNSLTSQTSLDVDDLRIPRSLGVAKYELYWIWSKQYSPSSNILLLDHIHNVYFQKGSRMGFSERQACDHVESELHLYEEKKRRRRLIHAPSTLYKGQIIENTYGDNNILNPASTHGQQLIIEAYLRAMVERFDETQCAESSCEWAFHNHLYYSGTLSRLPEYHKIHVHIQGTHAINSVGLDAPLRNTNLMHYDSDEIVIFNRPMGNGISPSWAVHDYALDPDLYQWIQKKQQILVQNLESSASLLSERLFQKDEQRRQMPTIRTIEPIHGQHRHDQDAVLTIIPEDCDVSTVLLFILSLRDTGFEGDLVLHIPFRKTMDASLVSFLMSEKNIVIYEGLFARSTAEYNTPLYNYDRLYRNNMYTIETNVSSKTSMNQKYTNDAAQPLRYIKVLAFDVYLYWTSQYNPSSSVIILDGEIESYFQTNPFHSKSCSIELNVYSEHSVEQNFPKMVNNGSDDISQQMKKVMGDKKLQKLEKESVIIPHVLFGHIDIVQQFLLNILEAIDQFSCFYDRGCDWSVVNYIWYYSPMMDKMFIHDKLRRHNQGSHIVHPIFRMDYDYMVERGLYDEDSKLYKNWDGSVSAVVMRYRYNDSSKKLNSYYKEKLDEFQRRYKEEFDEEI